ncbi:Radial spoke head 14 like protein [Argiope bruennichi]|uniref:Radial spoke head 14 like protein n=1 Tax=Argiope bruennichi TaxID=94029 RepID=A0A8T0EI17_ARGBR|nr:Radial spoke head 14 like protein [Argiope bruennichi]
MVDHSQRRKTAVTAIGGYVLNPKKHNLSFGRWAIPVMAKKMQSSEINERRRAVQSLCDFVFDSRRVASKEFTSVVPILKDLCEDPDSKLRLNVAKCLGAVTATPAGRRAFDNHGFYDETLNLLKDEDEEVRHAANIVLQRLVISPIGAEGLVEAGAIPVLIERISREPDYILEVLLQTLHICCLIDPESAVDHKGLETVIPLLKNSSESVRARAATVIKDLT